MSDQEIHGLASIIGQTGTLHGIEAPPDPADYQGRDEEFEKAYAEWFNRVCLWKTERKPLD